MASSNQQIRFVQAQDGVRLAYARAGRGPLLIKAATWLSHLEHDWDSPVWRHLLRGLGEQHSFVRYDERGCGLSDWVVPELSFSSWVSDLETLADTLQAPRFALLGISQGASIAIAYAVRHPERVSRLVLHGGYARGRLKRPAGDAARDEAETMVRLAELGWGRADESFRQFFTSQFIPGGTREQHAWFNELERISCCPANAARFMREFNDIDVTELLPLVRCPTLVLHSRHDLRVPYDEGRLIATHIPDAEFVTIDSANHLLLDSEPGWPTWLARVREFLQAEGGAEHGPNFDRLTVRQRDLVELLARGHDNSQIAAHLGLSEKTVRNHITMIFAKLEVENRGQAIVRARESGYGALRH
jgi:pimeloyl-ACP methyl ester carboxylesterase/DNA-binding CsgD family transcriptional regulator